MSDTKLGPLQLAEAELHIETTAGDEYVVTGNDRDAGVLFVEIEQHAADQIDQAEIELLNQDGRWGRDQRITRGDRAAWFARLEGETELTERWTGLVEDVAYERSGPGSRTVQLTADDYVFGILSDRVVYRTFIDEPIVEIIDSVVASKTPELDVDLPSVETVEETATLTSNGKNLLEIVESLAKRAECLLYGDGTTLRMEPIGDLETQLALSETNAEAAIGGQYSYSETPQDLLTFARIDGGDAAAADDVQETQTDWQLATETNRLTTRISPTRSKLDRVELVPRQQSDVGESIVVRIQRDDGGAPAAPGDQSADIARREVQPDDPRWVDGDWSQWLLQEHVAHDQDPWLIIETDGEQGQEVAVDGDGTPAFRTFYAYPVIAESASPSAEERYGRVERSISDDSLRSLTAAQEEANAQLDDNNRPREEFEFEAASPATFELAFGDAVRLDFPEEGATGRFVVRDRTDTWGQQLSLQSSYTLQSIRSI